MQQEQKCAVSTSSSACRKKQTNMLLVNEHDEVSSHLLVTKDDVKQYLSGSYLSLHTYKT